MRTFEACKKASDKANAIGFKVEMDVSLHSSMAGIYFHIPFCKQACHYCDFHFSTNSAVKPEMVSAIVHELELRRDYLKGEAVETIYFGGGTPSLLTTSDIALMLSTVAKHLSIMPGAEITLEANPDDLDVSKITDLHSLGINRLSIGIQSFDDGILKFLNRAHSSEDAIKSVMASQSAGFKNISIDLIYAIPGQSITRWAENINKALELNPQHISTYSLTIEDKTVFGRLAKRNRLFPVPDDEAATQLELLIDRLSEKDFTQYEVSNFAMPRFESRHNISYWLGKKYLGIGPSAHSYDQTTRQFNIANNHLYLTALKSDTIPATIEKLTDDDHVNEYLLTRLRTAWGINLKTLKEVWNVDLMTDNAQYVADLKSNGLATLINNHMILTRKGRLLADKIASDLFLTAPDL